MHRLVARLVIVVLVVLSAPSAPEAGEDQQLPKQTSGKDQTPLQPDNRGPNESPIVVKVLLPPKSDQESAQDAKDRADKSSADWWLVRLTGLIAGVGVIQAIVFWIQAGRLKDTIRKMDEIASKQTSDMQASIAEATRAASAMQGVALSMQKVASSASDSAESAKTVVEINRKMVDRQIVISELQSRAYLSIEFEGLIPQNIKTGFRFEPRIRITNKGNTPAYRLVHRVGADVLPHPISSDFPFPLPDPQPTRSVSTIGQGSHKIIGTVVPKLYSEDEARQIKTGIGQRIHCWGEIVYEDAFGISRWVRFSFSFMWMNDDHVMAFDTARHNEEN